MGFSSSVNISSGFSQGQASGLKRLPNSRLICMSDLHSPICVTLLMTSPRCGPSPTRMPLRSANVAAGSTTSASAMMVGVMNRSTDTMKSHLLNALYTR